MNKKIAIPTAAVLAIFSAIGAQLWMGSRPGTLHGAAWLTLKDGSSNVLRGQDVFVFDASIADKLKTDLEAANMSEEELGSERHRQELDDALTQFVKESIPLGRAHVKCGVDGKYNVSLARGKYLVFAVFETDAQEGFWALPITITPNANQELNLDNSNLASLKRY